MSNPQIRESSYDALGDRKTQVWELDCPRCGQIHGVRHTLSASVLEDARKYEPIREAMHRKVTADVASCATVTTLDGVREWSSAPHDAQTVEVVGELAAEIRYRLFSSPAASGAVTLTYTGFDLLNQNHTVEVRCGTRVTTLAFTNFDWLSAALYGKRE